MTQTVVWTLIVLSKLITQTNAQCNGTLMNITPNFSTVNISSPHYPNESSKAADCEWAVNITEHRVKVSLLEKSLHFQDPYGRKYCSGSYQVALNGDKLDCLPPIVGTEKQLIFESLCSTNVKNDTLHITYQSDGRTLGNQSVIGFRIMIQFTKCTYTGHTDPQATRTSMPSPSRYPDVTTSTRNPSENVQEPQIAIIALSVLCGLLLLMMILTAVYLVWRRSTKAELPHNAATANQKSTESGYIDGGLTRRLSTESTQPDSPVYDLPPIENEYTASFDSDSPSADSEFEPSE